MRRWLDVSASRALNVAFFMALVASALVLGPAVAHLFSLPSKIGLAREEYFIVQKAYRGWSQIGWLLAIQLASLASAAFLARVERRILVPTVLALACVAAAQMVFWLFTYPANVATANWTLPPLGWQALRHQWEYSHAAGAALQIAGFSLLSVAVLARRR
jgi:hypothetical protein